MYYGGRKRGEDISHIAIFRHIGIDRPGNISISQTDAVNLIGTACEGVGYRYLVSASTEIGDVEYYQAR